MQVKFYGTTFDVQAPYVAGHVATEAEARAFSQWQLTAIGNRYGAQKRAADKAHNDAAKKAFIANGGKAKDYVETTDPAFDAQAVFAKTVADFRPGVSTRTSGTGKGTAADPVASLVNFLAKEAIKAAIKAKGLKVKDFMDTKITGADGTETSKFMALVAQKIERDGDELRAQAEAQLASTQSDDLDLELETPQAEAA